jgi:uncharacterized RDD family membrane protein YckC
VSSFVSGEAVVLDLRIATVGTRTVAATIDVVVSAAAVVAAVVLIGGLAGSDDTLSAALTTVSTIGVTLGLPVSVETLSRGRSLGKLVMGLRVVRDDGGPLRFRHALVRGLLGLVELYLTVGAIAVIASAVSRQGKRLGDIFAGTVIIRERAPSATKPLAPLPTGWEHWAAELDLSLLSPPLALAGHQLLGRYATLSSPARERLAEALVSDISRTLGTPPPVGVPSITYLHIIVAERNRRTLAPERGSPEATAAPSVEIPAPPTPIPPTPMPPTPMPPTPPGGFALPS